MKRHFRLRLVSLAILPLLALAQKPAPPPARTGVQSQVQESTGTPLFTTGTNLVVEEVSVKDKSGKAITGLTAKDFTIVEDKTPQNITLFEFENVEEVAAAEPLPPPTTEPVAVSKLPKSEISREAPGKIRYRDRRLLALYFDMSSMPVLDQLRSLEAAQKFVSTQLTPADMMCIMRYNGASVDVLQDFTGDRDKLLTIIATLQVGESDDLSGTTNDASAADTGAAFGQDDSEFNIFTTDRQLDALETATKMLGVLNEKKSLIYFASGMNLNGVDNQAQLRATVNAAVRAGVSFWPIDARGLTASAPLGDATRGSPGGAGMYTGASAMSSLGNFQKSQDTLYALGSDTGGKAMLDFNDLSVGIVAAQKSITSYYIMGYSTSNITPDGKTRKVTITLNGHPEMALDYRRAYTADKVFGKFTTADKERQLLDALAMDEPVTELTMALEVNYFRQNSAEYFVPIMLKIPGSDLALARKGGAEHTLIDIIGEVKDDYGLTISNLREHMDIKLSDATAAEWAKKPIEYDAGFTTLPGNYSIKLLARDSETGKIGTFIGKFSIPNVDRETQRVPISSVVLSSQRASMSDAIAAAGKGDKFQQAQAVDPLVQEGQKLIPSVTRVFTSRSEMYVYLEAYEQKATTTQPLVAFVTFYKGSAKMMETPVVKVTDGLMAHSKAVPMRFSFPLSKLKPGEYNCQVTVLDPTSQKAAFWQAPIMVIP